MIKSGLYKLFRDWTFKVTLIVGASLALLLNLIYLLTDALISEGTPELIHCLCTGQNLFITSLSPTQNFGLAVPINLVIFTIGEFSCGTIRNKIIAGHSRISIYLNLLVIGLIFTFALLISYFAITVGLASLIGGFDIHGETQLFTFRPEYLYQYPLMAISTYIFITSFAILISTSIKNIGGSISIVIVGMLILYFIGFSGDVVNLIDSITDVAIKNSPQIWINPMYTFAAFSLFGPEIDIEWMLGSLVTPLYWSAIFTGIGLLAFNKADLK